MPVRYDVDLGHIPAAGDRQRRVGALSSSRASFLHVHVPSGLDEGGSNEPAPTWRLAHGSHMPLRLPAKLLLAEPEP